MFDWWDKLGTGWKIFIVIALIGITPTLIDLIMETTWGFFVFLGVIFVGILLFILILAIQGANSSNNNSNNSNSFDHNHNNDSNSDTFTENDIVEALKSTLHDKSTTAIAIYYSPFLNQWYLVNYWGQKESVTYKMTGYNESDYFETRDGKRFLISDSGSINKDKIYYYDTSN